MKTIFLSICLALGLVACSPTYYYTRISTLSEEVAQNDEGDFIIENDSLLVAYWFNGQDAPIFINIYNKSNEPLFVDWSRSALIMDDVAVSFKNNIFDIAKEPSAAIVESVSGRDDDYIVESAYPDGDDVSFIPPQSRITFQSYLLSEMEYEQVPDKLYQKSTIPDKDGILSHVKLLRFGEEDTPLKFKSYLTFYREADNPFTMNHEFYVSDLIKSEALTPKNAQLEFINKGDIFYTKREHKHKKTFGNVMLGTALAGLVVVGIIWGDSDSVEYYDDDY